MCSLTGQVVQIEGSTGGQSVQRTRHVVPVQESCHDRAKERASCPSVGEGFGEGALLTECHSATGSPPKTQ